MNDDKAVVVVGTGDEACNEAARLDMGAWMACCIF